MDGDILGDKDCGNLDILLIGFQARHPNHWKKIFSAIGVQMLVMNKNILADYTIEVQ